MLGPVGAELMDNVRIGRRDLGIPVWHGNLHDDKRNKKSTKQHNKGQQKKTQIKGHHKTEDKKIPW